MKASALQSLIRPRSIAVVGASETGAAQVVLKSLEVLGFDGAIYPVNPRYETVFGRECFSSLSALPEAPDVACLCVSGKVLEDAIFEVPKAGARSAVIFAGGFAEHGGAGADLQARMKATYREAGVALCGPNCMGIVTPSNASSTWFDSFARPDGLTGNVGFISHSGSVGISMLVDVRRYGFSTMISSGNEAVVTASDFLNYLVDDPCTGIIAGFIESVRDPEGFVGGLDRAAAAGKPVVILKVGRSARAQRSIATHTAGLAGDSRVFSEVLRSHGAIEVDDQDQLSEVLAALQSGRRPTGRRTVVVTSSGGQAELVLDVAAATTAELPPLAPATRREIEQLVGPITGDGNPLDAWGPGNFGGKLLEIFEALENDDGVDNIVLCRDSLDEQPMERGGGGNDMLLEAAQRGRKPYFVMSVRSGMMSNTSVKSLRSEGIATLTGLRQSLFALDSVARLAAPSPRPSDADIGEAARLPFEVRGRPTIHEADAKRALAAAGVRVTREELASDLPSAIAAAERIGYPVVLKLISDDVPHKSEHEWVIVGLKDRDALSKAWDLLAERRGRVPSARVAGVAVQEMIVGGVEVFIGISTDPSFGPMIAFGAGGVAIELLKDFSLRTLPLRQGEACAMIAETLAHDLLQGFRGAPPADVEALTEVIEQVAALAFRHKDKIREMDINPIRVLPAGHGCVVVDALIIPHADVPAPEQKVGEASHSISAEPRHSPTP